ncbi:hypothetical protein HPTD01_173 [Halomonas sp. TD01]|nr:hypothetical protein GME_05870 [Halomonas sp. TD01]CAH1041695.1 hypothetical protein HPTD01_173 [Halomonas sp. TD01]
MRLWRWLRTPWVQKGLVSLGLLAAVALWVEPDAVMAEVQRFAPGWMALALLISVLQVMLSAWRWQLTAGLIDVPLRYRYALREYYLALLVNQLLPGGVLGDAGRAHRHARQSSSKGSAWRAVVIERASGQLAIALYTLIALFTSPLWLTALGFSGLMVVVGVVGIVMVAGVTLMVWLRRSAVTLPTWCAALGQDMRRGLLQRDVWPRQLISSFSIVLSYGLVMVCAARAIGVELAALDVLALAPVLLLAMLVPLSIAGWGVREGAAAGIWMFVGLPSAQGVAISLAYGVLVLISSLPGIWVALASRTRATPSSSPPCSSPSGSAPAQHYVEERVVPAPERSHRRTQRTLKGVDGRHLQPRPAGTDQQRRDQQMQAVNRICFNELRNSNAAAFYQYPSQATVRQQGNNVGGAELTIDIQRQHAVFGRRLRHRCLWPGEMQSGCGRRGEQRQISWYAPSWVNHHSGRVLARYVAYRELGVISTRRARSDHYGICQRTQSVQVHQTFNAIDVVGMTAFRSNASIQALSQLGNHPARMTHQWQQTRQQLLRGACYRVRGVPAAVSIQRNSDVTSDALLSVQQPCPRLVGIDRHFIGARHGISTQKTETHHAGPCCPTQANVVRPNRQLGGLHVSH